MLNCIIIEDQPPAQRILKKYIGDSEILILKGTFADAIKGDEFLKKNHVDIIFLDINLPKLSGIDFLRSLENQPHIVLTTAFSDFGIESYEHNVIDYLLKPFSFERFQKSIHKVLKTRSSVKNNETVFIKSGYELIKINAENIIYIKSDGDYTEIITNNKVYLSNDSLKYWATTLNKTFKQIHKSYIINSSHLEKISTNKVYLLEGNVLPIGRAFKKSFIGNL
ncbi:DNA-binding response regulator, LytR/AlgR family [Tenacibaculum sp. MAR_2009_124]|uniref:LytR/AlgR family response regulator transcription factor n=1 Tax=Tenacibaculum sp. MAR_2009_124 TaxID=1250059 RepID=UPI00089C48F1|nr:LytTR family DNA-binding domain-containing protein [Tenacibaculum sp. MAR_2009_124]SEC23977.1 DNA-binding response regulator, LytR/AlgR family [Tenacibaculum sp. MAR_2009_124]